MKTVAVADQKNLKFHLWIYYTAPGKTKMFKSFLGTTSTWSWDNVVEADLEQILEKSVGGKQRTK